MSTPFAQHLGHTPQTEPLKGQVRNDQGGYSYPVDDWTRLDRFLILGSEQGSYYASERKLTLENAKAVERCALADGLRTVSRIVEISDAGRAPKNDPALLALALVVKHGHTFASQAAFAALPKVARIGTHLFHFAEYLKVVGRGWGRGTTRAFAHWYLDRNLHSLATQVIKYQQRDGWSHRDILRKSHPKTADIHQNAILRWVTHGASGVGDEPPPHEAVARLWAFERAKTLTEKSDSKKLIELIAKYDLPHECVPNEMKKYPEVWEALLPGMGLTALIRNLGKLTAVGLLTPLSTTATFIRERLGDSRDLKAARVHPLNLLVAQKIYDQGHGDKGSLSWEPVQAIVDALDVAFYASFKFVEPTGKRQLLAVDISASMNGSRVAGMPLTAREASAAMALVTANVEPETALFGFCTKFTPLEISPRQRLSEVIDYMNRLNMGGTDCAQPMVYALKHKLPVDAFFVYTDSETGVGLVHPAPALREYRQKMSRPARLAVVAMSSNEFTIADPNDAGMLDVVGFDTATPAVLADFIR